VFASGSGRGSKVEMFCTISRENMRFTDYCLHCTKWEPNRFWFRESDWENIFFSSTSANLSKRRP